MSFAFPEWEKFAVQQRFKTGCIPTGYEMLLRAAGAQGIDFETFQDEFDLDKSKKPMERPKNDFVSVADAVRKKYPGVNFKRKCFPQGEGAKKLEFVEDRIAKKWPVLVSIALKPFGKPGGYHIMPVVDATDGELTLLYKVESNGKKRTFRLRKGDFVQIHDTYQGGDDVAWLEGWE